MTLFDQMLAEVRNGQSISEDNAVHEVMQQIALAGLSRSGFFEKAAFYGGTCLHLLHGMGRFSEDLDFSLLSPDSSFRFEDYFPAVEEEFRLAGKAVEIKLKRKGRPTNIESAFLKESSDVFDIGFTTERRLKVKIEVDIEPPPKFQTEMKLIDWPRTCWVRAYDLPCLYAGKVSAVLFRNWKNRVKGRDWYDLVWYIRNRIGMNLAHFIERAKESDPATEITTSEGLISALDDRIDSVDFDDARSDVLPYLTDPDEVAIWSRAFFKEYIRRMIVVGN